MNSSQRRTSKVQVLKEGKFIRLLRKGEWEYVQRNNCTSIVIILAVNKEKKVILTEQFRPPVDKNVIEFPAGLVNDHGSRKRESVLTAAKRELLEETGYQAQRMIKVMEGPVSGGFTSDKVSVIRAMGLKKVEDGGGDHTEDITIHEVPLRTVDTWLGKIQKKGRLVDPKVYAGIYFLKKHHEKC